MSELIDRETVREFIKSYSHSTDVVFHMEKHLYEVPTIDAVPVVRCKDCKHRDIGDSGFEIDICRDATKRTGLTYIFCNKNGLFVPNTFYCADGERREG